VHSLAVVHSTHEAPWQYGSFVPAHALVDRQLPLLQSAGVQPSTALQALVVRHSPPVHAAAVQLSGWEQVALLAHSTHSPPLQIDACPLHWLAVRHAPPLHSAAVHSSGCEHSLLSVHCTQVVPSQKVPAAHWLVVRHAPPLQRPGVHPSGLPHWVLDVHATQPDPVQYCAAPLHAAPPLHVHEPDVQTLVLPLHCEFSVHVEQPDALQTCPDAHAGLALHSHVPELHVFAFPPQSALVQQSVDGMHASLHDFCPVGQLHPALVHVCPGRQAAPPLQVQTLDVQVFVSPVHSELDEHVVQPPAPHTIPPLQAAMPLHVQVPSVHVFVSPLQSELEQHSVVAMQTFPHLRWPEGQLPAGASEVASWWPESGLPTCDASGLRASAPVPPSAPPPSDDVAAPAAHPEAASTTSQPHPLHGTRTLCIARAYREPRGSMKKFSVRRMASIGRYGQHSVPESASSSVAVEAPASHVTPVAVAV
jgi:hypothetical protein